MSPPSTPAPHAHSHKRSRSHSQSPAHSANGYSKTGSNTKHSSSHHHSHRYHTHSASDLLRERRDLPIYHSRDAIIRQIQQYDTLILMGETGSGKSTQIPQYIY